MAIQTDITSTTTTDLTGGVSNFSVDSKSTDGEESQHYYNTDFTKWYEYYRGSDKSPSLVKKPIDGFATWVLGRGYTTEDTRTQVILNNLTGSGEDNFLAILWNMLVIKKVNGSSYAEIIRNDKGTLINLKPLSPERVRVNYSKKGVIEGYTYLSSKEKKPEREFKPIEIFHLMNDRVVDEKGGVSAIESIQWVIDAMQEAMKDWRRISHRSTIRILYVEEDDPTILTQMKTTYKDAIDKGELLILPIKRGEGEFKDLILPPLEAFLGWIRYCENLIYKGIGFPKALSGDAEGIPESGGKMVYYSHEPQYLRNVTELESDLWNQLATKVKFNRQASLQEGMNDQENKNTNQTQASQPSDTNIGGIE